MNITPSNISPIRENGVVVAIKVEFNASINLNGEVVNMSGSLVIDDLEDVINFDNIHQKIKQKLANEIIGE